MKTDSFEDSLVKRALPWLIIFAFYVLIARLLIHSGDDWAWGGQEGINRLENWFDKYNGRYLGNLVVLLITRSMIARLLIFAIINTGIIYVIWLLNNRKINISFIFLLILLVPLEIYRETYGWLAGFANYNVSTFFILLLFYLSKQYKGGVPTILIVLILSFVNQFFVENISLASVVIAAIGLFMALIYKEKISVYLSWLLGSIVGAYIMFANSAYHTEGNMRGFSNIDFSEMFNFLFGNWTELLIKNNAILLVLFAVVMYLLSNRNMYVLFINSAISIYFFIRYFFNVKHVNVPNYLLMFEFSLIIIFIVMLCFIVMNSSINNSNKRYFMVYFLSAAILVGPFLFVTPFGPRNILTSYTLLILALFSITQHILVLNRESVVKISTALVVSVALMFTILHTVNKYEEGKRIGRVKEAYIAGNETIEFKRLPFEFLGHDLTPADGSVQSNRQKNYHKISRETKFSIVNYYKDK